MPKVVLIDEIGPADVLRIDNLPEQEPGENEVRLRIEAIGLNRAEVMFRTGTYLEKLASRRVLASKLQAWWTLSVPTLRTSKSGTASARFLRFR